VSVFCDDKTIGNVITEDLFKYLSHAGAGFTRANDDNPAFELEFPVSNGDPGFIDLNCPTNAIGRVRGIERCFPDLARPPA
jgi:hypothetical protein